MEEGQRVELAELVRRRGIIKGQLTRLETYLGGYSAEKYHQVSARLQKCDEWWKEFQQIQCQIEKIDNSDNQQAERFSFEESYFDVVSLAKNLLDSNGQINSTNSQGQGGRSEVDSKSQVHLPIMEIPKFDGSYKQWLEFRDAFSSLVESNNSLSPIQKFYYLKNSVTGAAADVISSIQVSGDNYKDTWELLKEEFENKKLIAYSHLEALCEFPSMIKESHVQLGKFVNEIRKNVRALKALGQEVDNWDTILVFILEKKLDPNTKRAWKHEIKIDQFPSRDKFIAFLSQRCKIIESEFEGHSCNKYIHSSSKQTASDSKPKWERGQMVSKSFVVSSKQACTSCNSKEAHPLYMCKRFLELSTTVRKDEVRKAGLCWNCLRQGHKVHECTSRGCKYCGKKHNSLLHYSAPALATGNTSALGNSLNNQGNYQNMTNTINSGANQEVRGHTDIREENSREITRAMVAQGKQCSEILLSTATVGIMDNLGNIHSCRALLDSGSQSSFMTRELRDKLQLPLRKINVAVLGIGQGLTNVNHFVKTNILSTTSNFNIHGVFLVIDRISNETPSMSIDISELNMPTNIALADKSFALSGKVDLLLGSEIFWESIVGNKIKLGVEKPILQMTEFGWIIAGPVTRHTGNEGRMIQSCNLVSNISVQDQLEKFWSVEDCPQDRELSKEEERCKEVFRNTTQRDINGRFIVRLPFRDNSQSLGNSLDMACRRFKQLERKLAKDERFRFQYSHFIQEFINLGHMERLGNVDEVLRNQELESRAKVYYLPHHGIVKTSSSTTKLRVVFDASAATDNGISLNDKLLVGPKLQEDIFCILLRFRKHQIVFTADVEKMYRQVWVSEQQRDLQRIVWRFSPDKTLDIYRLKTITYGTGPASFLAVSCLQQLAEDHRNRYPKASDVIIKDFYMDDLLTGSDTIEEAKLLRFQVSHILSTAGFVLRKWMSNSKEVLLECEKNKDDTVEHFISEEVQGQKTLGLYWNSTEDTLSFQVNALIKEENDRVTKRTILSLVAQIFDPLGLIGPTVLQGKLILQELWKLKIGWDDEVSLEVREAWLHFRNHIVNINCIQIPRKVICKNARDIQIHCFCDASQLAYGACIYIRSTNHDGVPHIRLLCSKSRVAPIKVLSLPRLELCGAVLVARLSSEMLRAIDFTPSKIYYWCDSTIVLSWLAREPVHWKTFVANRTSEIQQLTRGHTWRHVVSSDNPADIISRGMESIKIQNCKLWWQGPDWLQSDDKFWPNSEYKNVDDIPEHRKVQRVFFTKVTFDIFNKYSSLSRLQRVTAYAYRFLKNSRCSKETRITGALSVQELQLAMGALVRLAQAQDFGSEIQAVLNSQSIQKGKLGSLSPFIDAKGILRVGGRLAHSDMEFEHKHPIILEKTHRLSELIILQEHYKNLHVGPQALLASIRLRYWIISGRSTVRKILRNCVVCFKARPSNHEQIMGNLPKTRITPSRPFTNCGVDYAGPFDIKVSKTRGHKTIKAYLCAFVCFATKAVHLELVSDLTTTCFLNCFKRFIARRGLCANIYSDNATNFIGANNVLRELFQFLQESKNQLVFSDYFSKNHIQWHFIPPRSPHFGGLWEAVIKSAKYHIKRVVGHQRLTYEELLTILTQIESCLNSRPLTPLTEDPDDLDVLTPGHFLIGSSLIAPPQQDLREANINRLRRYQLLTHLVQCFWSRWQKEYLTQLQHRHKWRNAQNPLSMGALVVIKEDNLPPLKWQLARIVQLHTGSDGVCRVVTVKGAAGQFKRAITRVCVLPIKDNLI